MPLELLSPDYDIAILSSIFSLINRVPLFDLSLIYKTLQTTLPRVTTVPHHSVVSIVATYHKYRTIVRLSNIFCLRDTARRSNGGLRNTISENDAISRIQLSCNYSRFADKQTWLRPRVRIIYSKRPVWRLISRTFDYADKLTLNVFPQSIEVSAVTIRIRLEGLKIWWNNYPPVFVDAGLTFELVDCINVK